MTRLTEEMVIARAKQSDLSQIKKLNCWGSDLSDVSIIKRMHCVEVLALSVNKITTLSYFENCKKLQELYLRKNNIKDINEIGYLQNLPALKYLWLEENPCCALAGPNYRAIVLRALPNLKKFDNVDVTQQEVDDALRGGDLHTTTEDDVYEDACETKHHRTSPQQQQLAQQQRRSVSPKKELPQLASPLANNSDGMNTVSDLYSSQNLNQNQTQILSSKPTTPTKEHAHPPSPKFSYNTITKDQRTPYQQYDRSPGSDQESPHAGYRESAAPIPPSMSTHSMKEYYQSDRPPHPAQYRHSQIDLSAWEEHQHHQHTPHVHHNAYGSQQQLQRRSAAGETERLPYRNGSARENCGDWEAEDRLRSRRPDGRFSDGARPHSPSMVNHYLGYHRRPINRNSNILSATLCLVKELDYASLEVLEHAVRCRIDEMVSEG